MPDGQIDDLGPVDHHMVELPDGHTTFTAEVAAELVTLARSGAVRLLDLLVLCKDGDGTIDAFEVDDLDGPDELRPLHPDVADVIAAADVANLATAMRDGSTAGVVVWENRWAAPFATAVRRSGGQLIATGRIPAHAIVASLDSEPDARRPALGSP